MAVGSGDSKVRGHHGKAPLPSIAGDSAQGTGQLEGRVQGQPSRTLGSMADWHEITLTYCGHQGSLLSPLPQAPGGLGSSDGALLSRGPSLLPAIPTARCPSLRVGLGQREQQGLKGDQSPRPVSLRTLANEDPTVRPPPPPPPRPGPARFFLPYAGPSWLAGLTPPEGEKGARPFPLSPSSH